MKFNEFTRTAIDAAQSAGDLLLKYFGKSIDVRYKGRINPVTAADERSQKLISGAIRRRFPAHTVVGEEDAVHRGCGRYCWLIDPLDGTVNFIHGIPIFSVSIGLSLNGSVIAGVVYAPMLKELFVAQKGGGAFLNGKRIRVSTAGRLMRSVVITGFSYDIDRKAAPALRRLGGVLKQAEGIRRLGSAAIDLAYVACGRAEVFWEEGLSPWDVAAGSLLVSEAGGRVTDFSGGSDYIYGKSLLATNGRLHAAMRRIID